MMLTAISSVSIAQKSSLTNKKAAKSIVKNIASIKKEMDSYAKAIVNEENTETQKIFGHYLNNLLTKLKEFESEYINICKDTKNDVVAFIKRA